MQERIEAEGRVKQAVKEALTEQTIIAMQGQLTELKAQIAEGFKGMHQRQDTTNGKVLKSRDDIIGLQSENASIKEKLAAISKIQWAIGSAIGLAVLGAVLKLVLK